MEAGPDRGEVGAVVDGDRDAPVAGAEGLLQDREHVVVDREAGQLPLALERLA